MEVLERFHEQIGNPVSIEEGGVSVAAPAAAGMEPPRAARPLANGFGNQPQRGSFQK